MQQQHHQQQQHSAWPYCTRKTTRDLRESGDRQRLRQSNRRQELFSDVRVYLFIRKLVVKFFRVFDFTLCELMEFQFSYFRMAFGFSESFLPLISDLISIHKGSLSSVCVSCVYLSILSI